MRRVLTLMVAILMLAIAVGCGGQSKCEEACDKLKSCGVTVNIKCEGECASAADECAADCVLKYNCDQIKNSDPEYAKCVFACLPTS
jgi:hypothetical protein